MAARDERIPTLRTWFETHLEIKAASVTPGTVDEYRREAARAWMPRLGRLPLDMITPEAVTSWIAWQRQQETARSAKRRAKAIDAGETPPAPELVRPKTIAKAQRLLSSVLSAVGERYPVTNAAKGAKIPSDAESAEMVFLTREEYAATGRSPSTSSPWWPSWRAQGHAGERRPRSDPAISTSTETYRRYASRGHGRRDPGAGCIWAPPNRSAARVLSRSRRRRWRRYATL